MHFAGVLYFSCASHGRCFFQALRLEARNGGCLVRVRRSGTVGAPRRLEAWRGALGKGLPGALVWLAVSAHHGFVFGEVMLLGTRTFSVSCI